MYIPEDFVNNNLQQLHALIEKYNFATIISTDHTGEIIVSHIPVILDRSISPHGTLIWHMANQNDHVNVLNGENHALCVFHGPHSYISHSWYQSEPNVPTWNYAVVHAHGVPAKATERELSDDLHRLVNLHESVMNGDHQHQIPEEYKSKLLKHITGFRMNITKLEGKYKLGQNRSMEDQQSMKQALRNHPDSKMLAELIDQCLV